MTAENNYTSNRGSTIITRQPMELETADSDFRYSDVACILQQDREENADLAYAFGFLTCFCCNILGGLLTLYLANQASNEFKERKYDKGVLLRRWSYLFSFISLLLGITILVLIVTGYIRLF